MYYFTILGGLSQRSLVQYFQPEHAYQVETIPGIKDMIALPENAKKYISAVEEFIGAKVSSVSTSPERDDTILVENPFDI